jgi:hypothetical protein
VRYLVENGADIHAPASTSRDGRTALQAAAEAGHLDVVDYLLDRGADPNQRRACCGLTALEAAVQPGHTKNFSITTQLLQAGAQVALPSDALHCNHCRYQSAIGLAARIGSLDLVELLMRAESAEDGTRQIRYENALKEARENNHYMIMGVLQHTLDEMRKEGRHSTGDQYDLSLPEANFDFLSVPDYT